MLQLKQKIKRGKYKIKNIFDNPRYTRVLFLLILGHNSRKKLEQMGINASTWENKYKPTLLEQKIIYDDGKSRPNRKKEYILNFGKMAHGIVNKMVNDLKLIREQIHQSLKRLKYEQNKIENKEALKESIEDIEFNLTYLDMLLKNVDKKNEIIQTKLEHFIRINLTKYVNKRIVISDGLKENLKPFNDEIINFLLSYVSSVKYSREFIVIDFSELLRSYRVYTFEELHDRILLEHFPLISQNKEVMPQAK